MPRLTFFCELELKPLQDLFNEQIIADLVAMQASLSLGILDLSPARAGVVRRLNQAGVPVIAWLLLPKEQGYWFNLDNAPQAIARYADFKAWTEENGLCWAGVGLDIEPDIRDMARFGERKWLMLPSLLRKLLERNRLKGGRAAYRALVSRIHADGYPVDAYQFPVIADERQAGSTLLQRLAGLVDLPSDREVWMLYTSLLRPHGAGFLASYAPQAQSVGLGVTGGGVDVGVADRKPLTWQELARDLRLAWCWCDDIHVFSLEGCVEQGFMEELSSFAWDYPVLMPEEGLARVESFRKALRSGLWLSAHTTAILAAAFAGALVGVGVRRYLARRYGRASDIRRRV
ncbi:MAG: hypothetical protein JXA78_09290 [Anaerolineales bacterium]|nr:hypothetical protein [Anaerolineales bacterium]